MKILNSRTISETSFKRQSFTHEEIKFLEKHYTTHKYADKIRRTELAKILLIDEKKIGTWFRNKRRQERNRRKSNMKLLLSANMLLSHCLPGDLKYCMGLRLYVLFTEEPLVEGECFKETSDRKSFVKTLALSILLGKEEDDEQDEYDDPIDLFPCSNCCQTKVVYPCPCEKRMYCGSVCQKDHWQSHHKNDPEHI